MQPALAAKCLQNICLFQVLRDDVPSSFQPFQMKSYISAIHLFSLECVYVLCHRVAATINRKNVMFKDTVLSVMMILHPLSLFIKDSFLYFGVQAVVWSFISINYLVSVYIQLDELLPFLIYALQTTSLLRVSFDLLAKGEEYKGTVTPPKKSSKEASRRTKPRYSQRRGRTLVQCSQRDTTKLMLGTPSKLKSTKLDPAQVGHKEG